MKSLQKLSEWGKRLPLLLLFALAATAARAQDAATIRGTVTDEAGQPVPGAAVAVKGTTTGTSTDVAGRYALPVPAGAVLVFSFVGMETQEVPVAGKSTIDVQLRTQENAMQEVVVTGYSTQRKADLTGAVSVVNVGEALGKTTSTNALSALEGRVSGMMVNTDGAPGSGGTTVRIRGIGTINNSNPLYVIDGIATSENLNSISPADIESIQVLKDASSASIYGARAANGVIIVTTKKGKAGRLGVELSITSGVQTVARQFEMLNATQWGDVFWQANLNDGNLTPQHPFYGSGATPVPVQWLDAEHKVPFSNENWQNSVYSPAWMQTYSAVVTHGTERATTMFSASYTNQDGLIDHTFYERFSARLNSTYHLSKWVNVGENLAVARWNDRGAATQDDRGIPYLAMRQHPAIPVRDIDGSYTNPMAIFSSDYANPVRQLELAKDNRNESWRILGNAFIELLPVEGLALKTNVGVEHIQFYNDALNRKVQPSDRNNVTLAYGEGNTLTWTNTATYAHTFADRHRLNLLAGTEAITYHYKGLSAMREGFAFEDSHYMVIGAGDGTQTNGGNKSAWALFSLFAKADYNFADRYLLSATIRRDASSRLAEGNNAGIFPAFSAAWRISEEAFMPKTEWLTSLKIRAGWGQTGNAQISDYATYSTFGYDIGVGAYDLNAANTESVSGIIVRKSGNTDLRWETTTQTNVGLDLSLFGNALNVSFDYFFKKTTDMLTIPPTLSVMGENAAIWMNTGDMENRGFEFLAEYASPRGKDLRWGASLSVSRYVNKLVRLNNFVRSDGGEQRNMVGQPIGVFYGYVADGLFATEEEALNYADQPGKGKGRIRYRDVVKDGSITDKDQQVIGDPNPDLAAGLNLSLSYRNVTLSCFIDTELSFDIYNTTKRQLDFMTFGGASYINHGTSTLDAWTPANTGATVPALTLLDANNETRMSSYFIEDGSYVKVKNIRLEYAFGERVLKALRMASLGVYAQVDNVCTLTGYSGLEPALPLGKVDRAPYPIARTFSVGLNVKF